MDNDVKALVEKLTGKFSGLELVDDQFTVTAYIGADQLVPLMQELKRDFEYLVDLTAVDQGESFDVVYHLMGLKDMRELRIKVRLAKEKPAVPSLVTLWNAANVQEREAFDMMGIVFESHPDLRRILCPDDFEGHPLRKDYQLENRH
ncbi:MAG: NADH-quinone oxidoreductase subunit C [Bacillota bacterium]